jgi:hypothetical protein
MLVLSAIHLCIYIYIYLYQFPKREVRRNTRAEWPTATHGRQKPPRRLPRATPEPPRATWSLAELHRAAQSSPEPPRAPQSRPGPHKACQSHAEPSEPPRNAQGHPEPPRATQNCSNVVQGCPELPRADLEPPMAA